METRREVEKWWRRAIGDVFEARALKKALVEARRCCALGGMGAPGTGGGKEIGIEELEVVVIEKKKKGVESGLKCLKWCLKL